MESGTHDVVVAKVEFYFTMGKGTPALKILFTKEGNAEDYIYGDIYLSDAALPMARKSLKTLGFDVDKREFDEIAEKSDCLNGAKCTIVVEDEEYNGNVRPKVKWINARGSAVAGKKLMSELTKKLREAKKKPDDVGLPEGFEPATGVPEDKIPF